MADGLPGTRIRWAAFLSPLVLVDVGLGVLHHGPILAAFPTGPALPPTPHPSGGAP